VRGFMDCDGWV